MGTEVDSFSSLPSALVCPLKSHSLEAQPLPQSEMILKGGGTFKRWGVAGNHYVFGGGTIPVSWDWIWYLKIGLVAIKSSAFSASSSCFFHWVTSRSVSLTLSLSASLSLTRTHLPHDILCIMI